MTRTVREELSRAELLLEKGDYKDALELVETLEARGGLSVDGRLACSLVESRLNVKLGELEKALALADEVLQTARGRENRLLVVDTLIVKAEISWHSGKLDEGLRVVEEGEGLLEGMVLESVGEQEEQVKRRKGELLHQKGVIHWYKGDLDQALEYFQRSLALYKESGIKKDVALSLTNIGEIYRKKGNLEEALEYYQQSLAIYEEMANDPSIAVVLFELVLTALEIEDSALAQQYLQRLQQINERTDNRIIDQRYRVARALSLKTSKRARHRMKAGEILEQVVEEEVSDHSLTVTAMIHLCDLLLSELKMTGDDELFGEIKELTSRLLEIAKQQSSHSLLAETYLLQSKLALIELDMGQARKFLTKAHLIAQKKGLHSLARTVAYERDLLRSQLNKWELIIDQNPSKPEMIDLTRLNDLRERMIRKTVANIAQEEKRISEKKGPKKKYKLVYLDLLKDSPKVEKNNFRVGVAQIGLSQEGDILHEFYEEHTTGLFGLREDKVEIVGFKVKNMVEIASTKDIDILIFPELTVDLNYAQLLEDVASLARAYEMYIIPGSYHDQETRRNVSVVVGPDGILWRQEKHIPATIHYGGKRFKEGIEVGTFPRKTIVCNSEFGRVAIAICRDFLDMDLRVEPKKL